jgi:hypothetical protein
MIGGDPADVEEMRPILACRRDSFTYCGPLGPGRGRDPARGGRTGLSVPALRGYSLSGWLAGGRLSEGAPRT